jgi:hypothetical protein
MWVARLPTAPNSNILRLFTRFLVILQMYLIMMSFLIKFHSSACLNYLICYDFHVPKLYFRVFDLLWVKVAELPNAPNSNDRCFYRLFSQLFTIIQCDS